VQKASSRIIGIGTPTAQSKIDRIVISVICGQRHNLTGVPEMQSAAVSDETAAL